MVTGGTEVPQQLLLRLLLQLTEELISQRSAPQGEEEGPGDPPGGVPVMHQVTVDLLLQRSSCAFTGTDAALGL